MVDLRNHSHQLGLPGDALDQRGQLAARQPAEWSESQESGPAGRRAWPAELEWQSAQRDALLQYVAVQPERARHSRECVAPVFLRTRHAELRSRAAADFPGDGIQGAPVPPG